MVSEPHWFFCGMSVWIRLIRYLINLSTLHNFFRFNATLGTIRLILFFLANFQYNMKIHKTRSMQICVNILNCTFLQMQKYIDFTSLLSKRRVFKNLLRLMHKCSSQLVYRETYGHELYFQTKIILFTLTILNAYTRKNVLL